MLSLHFNYYYKVAGTDEYKDEFLGLNFRLMNGEELMFEDIFKSGEDVSIIARMGLYKYLADELLYDFSPDWYENIHYDFDKKMWTAKHHWYSPEDEKDHEEEVEYIPPMTDYEIEKKVKRFLNEDKKNFYFTPSVVVMDVGGTVCSVNLYDIPEKVVIYDKYLADKDLYERNDIGIKGIINCSTESNIGKYKVTKYESDNLFYNIDAVNYQYSMSNLEKSSMNNYADKKLKEEAEILKTKIEDYKKLAASHPDKAYFVFLQSDFDWGGSYQTDQYYYNNMVSIQRGSKVIICDIKDRQEVLDEILERYRYYNMGFYGTIYRYLYLENEDKYEVENDSKTYYYDIYTGNEIQSIDDIFIEGVDYKKVLNSYARHPNSSGLEYEMSLEGIEIRDNVFYGYEFVGYHMIKDFVKIRNIGQFVLEDSSTRKYELNEIQGYTKDQLNIAYNEIFARHGHDFKTNQLKQYFSIWEWYQPVSGKTVTLEELSDIEKANVELIRSVMNGTVNEEKTSETDTTEDIVFDEKTLSIDLGKNWEKYTRYSYNNYVPSQRYLVYNHTSSRYSKGNARKEHEDDMIYSCTFEGAIDSAQEKKTIYVYSDNETKTITIPNPFIINGNNLDHFNSFMVGDEMTIDITTLNPIQRIEYSWLDEQMMTSKENQLVVTVPDFGNLDYNELHIKIVDIYNNAKENTFIIYNKQMVDLDYEVYAVTSVGVEALHNKSYTGTNTYYLTLVNPNDVSERYKLAPYAKIPEELQEENVLANHEPIFVAAGIDKNNLIGNIVILPYEYGSLIEGSLGDEKWCLVDGKFFKGYHIEFGETLEKGVVIEHFGFGSTDDYRSSDRVFTLTSTPHYGGDNQKLSSFVTGRGTSKKYLNNISGKAIGLKDNQGNLQLLVFLGE